MNEQSKQDRQDQKAKHDLRFLFSPPFKSDDAAAFILKTRRPTPLVLLVILKTLTCNITDIASSTNTPADLTT